MKVTNILHLKQLIFNEYVVIIPLAFTGTGADSYCVYQDRITKEVYIEHTDNCYYTYSTPEEAIQEYKGMGYQVSYDLR